MDAELRNAALLVAQAFVYFAFFATLFRFRRKVGLGVFTSALGTLHFLETYLASTFYVATPFGVISPGSSVLFSGKLVMILLLYLKEDAATVRQPIYGIFAGNLLTLLLGYVLGLHVLAGAGEQSSFVGMIGGLMLWGTVLLFIDSIAVILLYERLGKRLAKASWPRMVLALGAVLAFDQVGFYLALRWIAGVPIEAFYAGLNAKLCAAALFAGFAALYLRLFERQELKPTAELGDVFGMLTYRERYEALASHTGRDRTTMLRNRQTFDGDLGVRLQAAADARHPATLALVEVDAQVFHEVSRRLGRDNSEALLRTVSRCLEDAIHDDDEVYRLDHMLFAVICCGPASAAQASLRKLRNALAVRSDAYGAPIHVAAGLASAQDSGFDAGQIFAHAEQALVEARRAGADQTALYNPASVADEMFIHADAQVRLAP